MKKERESLECSVVIIIIATLILHTYPSKKDVQDALSLSMEYATTNNNLMITLKHRDSFGKEKLKK